MKPLISVVIPAFNDPDGLEETLQALLQQNCPKELFEILVVDNGSTDDTFSRAKAMGERFPERMRVLQENTVAGSYAARNKGIAAARGALLCFVDANVTMDADFLVRIQERFARTGVDYLGCEVRIYSPHNTLTAKYQKGRGFQVRWYLEHRQFAPTCCLAIRREVLDGVGPFDPRLESGGDWEFGRRVHAAGFTQGYAEDIRVYHPARWRYQDLVKKNLRCARGEAQLMHFFPGEYAEIRTKLTTFGRFLPRRPMATRGDYRQRNVEIGLLESIILSCFHIPLSVFRLISFRKELKKLNTVISIADQAA